MRTCDAILTPPQRERTKEHSSNPIPSDRFCLIPLPTIPKPTRKRQEEEESVPERCVCAQCLSSARSVPRPFAVRSVTSQSAFCQILPDSCQISQISESALSESIPDCFSSSLPHCAVCTLHTCVSLDTYACFGEGGTQLLPLLPPPPL